MSKNKKVADDQLQPIPLKTLEKVGSIIDASYTKIQLVEICKSLHRYLEPIESLPIAKGPGQTECMEIQLNYICAKNAKKAVYINYAALFLSSAHNFAIYLNSLPEDYCNLWSYIMLKKFVRCKYLVDDERREFLNWFTIFDRTSYTKDGRAILSITLDFMIYDLIQPYLEDYFSIPQIDFKTDKDLSNDQRYDIYSNVDGIESEFYVMEQLLKHNYKIAPGFTIANSTIQSMVKHAQIPLPVAEVKPSNVLNRTAASLFIYTYIDAIGYIRKQYGEASIYEGMRYLLKTLFGSSYMLHNRFMPHLAKQTARLSEAANSSVLMGNFVNILSDVMNSNMDVWYDVESLVTRLEIKTRPSSALFYAPFVYDYNYVKRRSDKSSVEIGEAVDQVVTPLIRALLLMCATMGLCDVALDLSRIDDENSYVEPVRYVRFNAMARFVFGLDDEMPTLSNTKSNMADDFKLSDDHLVIHVQRNSRFAGMLPDYAERLTPTLWRVTHATFMRNCATMTDMTQKIETFKKNFCPNPPQNWLDFFNDFSSRIKVMEQSKKTYAVFNVPKNRTDIQRLILSDPVLSQLAVRAEGYLVLVESLNLQKFRKRFEALGYTLG